MKQSLTQKTFKAFFWQFGGTVFKAIVQIGVLFFLARLISKSDFGIIQSAIIVIGLAQLLSQMGVGPSLVQRKTLSSLHIRSALAISFTLSFVLYAVVYGLSGYIAEFFKMPDLTSVLEVVALIFVLEGITTVSQSLLLREMKQKALVMIDVVSYAVGYGGVSIFMAYRGYGYWALVGGQLTQSFLKLVLSYIVRPHSIIPYFGKEEYSELLYFGGGFTLAKLFNFFGAQGDKIVAGRYLGSTLLGVYSNAYSLMIQPASLIGNSIDRALFPAMASKQHEKPKLIKAFISGAKIITFVSVPLSIILIITARPLITLILGTKWLDVVLPFQILTSVFVFRIGYKMGDSLCRATGKVYRRAILQLIYAIVMLLGTYIGALYGGVKGVAIGAAFAIFVNYVLMIDLSIRILSISWSYYFKKVFLEDLIPIICLISLFVVIYIISEYFLISEIVNLFISYLLFIMVSGALFYFHSERVSFIKDIPFKGVISKITRQL